MSRTEPLPRTCPRRFASTHPSRAAQGCRGQIRLSAPKPDSIPHSSKAGNGDGAPPPETVFSRLRLPTASGLHAFLDKATAGVFRGRKSPQKAKAFLVN